MRRYKMAHAGELTHIDVKNVANAASSASGSLEANPVGGGPDPLGLII